MVCFAYTHNVELKYFEICHKEIIHLASVASLNQRTSFFILFTHILIFILTLLFLTIFDKKKTKYKWLTVDRIVALRMSTRKAISHQSVGVLWWLGQWYLHISNNTLSLYYLLCVLRDQLIDFYHKSMCNKVQLESTTVSNKSMSK